MFFHQILNEQHGCCSYLIASQRGEAAIVDPPLAADSLRALVAARGFQVRQVIDTHIHADHISGARGLAREYGAALRLYEGARVEYPFEPLADGDEIALDEVRIRAAHTPGHRPDLITLLVSDTARSAEPEMLLTADSLLVGDAGRPDFNGGDASAQFDSVQRLLGLQEWIAVFPGHFEGVCGGAMAGPPSTTIGYERRFNPLAQLDRASFIQRLEEDKPERPLNMADIEAHNRGLVDAEWVMLTSDAPLPEVTVAQADQWHGAAYLLDVREPEEFAAGHIPGTVNVPQADLSAHLGELPRDQPIVTVCRTGSRSYRSGQFLRQAGFEQVSSLAGGTHAWQVAGKPVEMPTS